MSRAQTVVAVLLLGVAAVLLARVVALEARVDALARARASASPEAATQVRETARTEARDRQLDATEERVARLQGDVDAVAGSIRAKVDRVDLERKVSPDRVIGLVEGELARIGEIQLAHHKERWAQAREKWARDFAELHRLSPGQQESIRKLTLEELDGMMDILHGRETQDDLARASAEWTALLQETDRRAHAVLNARQTRAWDEARAFERSLLKPYIEE